MSRGSRTSLRIIRPGPLRGPHPGAGSMSTLQLQSVDPALEVGQLSLGLARQQVDEAALDALALEEGVVDLLGDRQLDAVSSGQRERGIDRVAALRDATEMLLDVLPA